MIRNQIDFSIMFALVQALVLVVKYVRGLSEVKMWNMYYSESFKINVSKMICFKILLLLFVINFVEAGRRLIGFNFKAVSPTGYQQCLKLCIYRSCRLPFGQFQQKSTAVRAEFTTWDGHCPSHGKYRRNGGFHIYISKTSFPNVSFKGWEGGGVRFTQNIKKTS